MNLESWAESRHIRALPMSGDEVFLLIASGLISLVMWARWIRLSVAFRAMRRSPGDSWVWVSGVTSILLLWFVLKTWASHDVRDSGIYLLLYVLLGFGLTGLALVALDRLGLSLRDDCLERPNVAARATMSGAILGFAAAYAGANIGDGPGWWVVVFCAFLSMGSLLLGWSMLVWIGQVGEAIVVERNPAVGLRLAVWFICAGFLQGRAVAGDWTGTAGAVRDYLFHSGAGGALLVTALLIERAFVSNRSRRLGFTSVILPVTIYLCFALLTLLKVHPW